MNVTLDDFADRVGRGVAMGLLVRLGALCASGYLGRPR